MPEQEQTLMEKVQEKFTKVNVYAVLIEIEKLLTSGEDATALLQELAAAVKPQKGGGASANPSKVIDGITYHYCRYKDDYVPEDQMNMTNGKSKSTSILASRIAYRIGKAADDIAAKAMAAFVAGDYESGAELNKEATELRDTIDNKETFTDEAMANSIYHPDYGKEVKEEKSETTTEEQSSELI